MDTREILDGIELSQSMTADENIVLNNDAKYIVFTVGTGLYALLAEDVQEIILDMDIHYLPFVPPFVRGLINRLGEPLTVLDLVSLFQGQPLQGKAFIILKPHISKMAFLISAVQDILRVSSGSIRHVSINAQSQDAYVEGVFTRKDEDVTILSLTEIIAAVKNALDAES